MENQWFCLVRDEKQTYGHICVDDDWDDTEPSEWSAGEFATPITSDIMVSSSTTLLELPQLFSNSSYYFVLTGNEITHVVSWRDVDKPPMKLCIFLLVMELESQLLRVLSVDTDALKLYLTHLSPKRLRKFEQLCKLKHKGVTPKGLLFSTNFMDKKELLLQVPDIVTKLTFPTLSQINRAIGRVQEIRNQIAHGGSILELLRTPQDIYSFVLDVRKIDPALSNLEDEDLLDPFKTAVKVNLPLSAIGRQSDGEET